MSKRETQPVVGFCYGSQKRRPWPIVASVELGLPAARRFFSTSIYIFFIVQTCKFITRQINAGSKKKHKFNTQARVQLRCIKPSQPYPDHQLKRTERGHFVISAYQPKLLRKCGLSPNVLSVYCIRDTHTSATNVVWNTNESQGQLNLVGQQFC